METERFVSVDLNAVRRNIAGFTEWVAPAAVMAVVKADGYGHGAVPVAQAALEGGATWIGVAHIQEALALRSALIRAPVLAWLHTPRSDFTGAVLHDVRIGVSSLDELARVDRAAEAAGRQAVIHLKIDTGLGRNGATAAEWPRLVARAAQCQERGTVDVEGVFSHLSAAEDSTRDAETSRQKNVLDRAVDAARASRLNVQMVHLANTAASLRRSDIHYDMVRIGIGTYGLSPLDRSDEPAVPLTPVLSLRTVLSGVKVLPANHGISYGARYITPRATRIGLVPVGYGDGLPREARGMSVLINGRGFPILGVIAMDQIVVDLGPADGPDVDPPVAGDDVVVISTEGPNTVDSWAHASGTINYEIVTRLTPRVPRRYI